MLFTPVQNEDLMREAIGVDQWPSSGAISRGAMEAN
jgi:hypothetical protein